MAAFNTVDSVVKGYIDKFPERYTEANYWTMLRHALSWFNQRDRLLAPARATVEIMVQPDRTAALPDDFVDWLVVGRQVGNYVQNLAFNERVPRLAAPVDAPAPPAPAGVGPGPCCWYGGYLGGELCGYGPGLYEAEEFVIDAEAGLLYTNSEVPEGPLYLHYIYNADKPNVATAIPADYAMPLEYWIEWQMNRRASDAPMLKKEYYDELKRVSRRANPMDIGQLYNIFDNA